MLTFTYIRTKDGIITSHEATHELIEDICDYHSLKPLKKGSYVSIGEKYLNFYGRWVDLIDENGYSYAIRPSEVESVTKELPHADTIEELCDGFWWENTMYKEPIFIPNFSLVLDRVKAWKENDKELDNNSFDGITIYGSIYIHGYGWKHVCKVNKNEERLELL